jgi:hypothetical protein
VEVNSASPSNEGFLISDRTCIGWFDSRSYPVIRFKYKIANTQIDGLEPHMYMIWGGVYRWDSMDLNFLALQVEQLTVAICPVRNITCLH